MNIVFIILFVYDHFGRFKTFAFRNLKIFFRIQVINIQTKKKKKIFQNGSLVVNMS